MEVKEKIQRAFRHFMAKDSYLLMVAANERSLTHRLAIYLEHEFPDYNVDCEFQKNFMDTKKLHRFIKPLEDNGGTVYPDIIVHHRGTADNFIVIESKPSTKDETCKQSLACACDRCKLWAYRKELKYQRAFYIIFPFGDELKNFSKDSLDEYLVEIVEDPIQPAVVAK